MKPPDRDVPATLILVLALSFPPIVAGTEAPLLMVANRASHDISFVDLARGEIVDRIQTGDGPHLLSNVSNGRVAATGYGVSPKPHAEPVSSRPRSSSRQTRVLRWWTWTSERLCTT